MKNIISQHKLLQRDKMRAVDFYLTKSCNKDCHYCTAWTKEMRNLIVDIDYLDELLSWFDGHEIRIQFLGGEPALVKNLMDCINTVKKYPNLTPAVLSNSLVRNRYPEILEDPHVYYFEHLILDIYEDEIKKLGPKSYNFFPKNDLNNYNVIIQTPGFVQWGKKHGLNKLNHRNTQFKEYNSRSPSYEPKWQESEFKRKICAAFPSVPVVDFEMMKLRHCSKKVINGSKAFDLTEKNIQAMLNYELFEYEDYCQQCMEPIPDRPQDQILEIIEVNNI
jgi:hypothetical protein